MGNDFSIILGTVGNGLQFSRDGGKNWTGGEGTGVGGMEGNVRALHVHPHDPATILAGTDRTGLFRSEDLGRSWSAIESPMSGMEIWSIDIDPVNPDRYFVGTRPEGFRSFDGGESWEALAMGVDREAMLYPPRTTRIVVDPISSETIWACTEVNGAYRSKDAGETWTKLPAPGPSIWHQDNHCMLIRNGRSRTIFLSGPEGVASSNDDGETWEMQTLPPLCTSSGEVIRVGSQTPDHAYCRGMIFKADNPNEMFLGVGNTIPGDIGGIRHSQDGGRSWALVNLPVQPNSVLYWLATHPTLPNVIVGVSLFGYVYVSEDGGAGWQKLTREFGQIRTVAIVPN